MLNKKNKKSENQTTSLKTKQINQKGGKSVARKNIHVGFMEQDGANMDIKRSL